MSNDLVVIYSAANAQQAALLGNILEDEGIASQISNIALQGAAGELPVGWTSSPCVLVRQEDQKRARQIALEFEQDLASRPDDESLPTDQPSDTPWPECPQCQKQRRTRCPSCGVEDTELAPAEFLVSDVSEYRTTGANAQAFHLHSSQGAVMCSVCDVSFQPEYLRYCHHCEFDFGEGTEPETKTPSDTNSRVLIVAVGLAVLGLGACMYFWWLLR